SETSFALEASDCGSFDGDSHSTSAWNWVRNSSTLSCENLITLVHTSARLLVGNLTAAIITRLRESRHGHRGSWSRGNPVVSHSGRRRSEGEGGIRREQSDDDREQWHDGGEQWHDGGEQWHDGGEQRGDGEQWDDGEQRGDGEQWDDGEQRGDGEQWHDGGDSRAGEGVQKRMQTLDLCAPSH